MVSILSIECVCMHAYMDAFLLDLWKSKQQNKLRNKPNITSRSVKQNLESEMSEPVGMEGRHTYHTKLLVIVFLVKSNQTKLLLIVLSGPKQTASSAVCLFGSQAARSSGFRFLASTSLVPLGSLSQQAWFLWFPSLNKLCSLGCLVSASLVP